MYKTPICNIGVLLFFYQQSYISNMIIRNQHQVIEILNQARKNSSGSRRILKSLSKLKKPELDAIFAEKHDEVFEKTDCLACANCCKTSSPIVVMADVDRIAKYLKIRPGDFVVKYLRMDEDEDYVFQLTPCVFLNEDHTCSIYEVRPRACREYPHTDRKHMHTILELTFQNSMVCPAVYEIIRKLDGIGR